MENVHGGGNDELLVGLGAPAPGLCIYVAVGKEKVDCTEK